MSKQQATASKPARDDLSGIGSAAANITVQEARYPAHIEWMIGR